MTFKPAFTLVLALLFFFSTHAQDKIYKKNGEVVLASIKEVTQKTIVYRREDNPDGPVYTIGKNAIDKIVYKNGTEDTFEDEAEADNRPSRMHGLRGPAGNDKRFKYNKNILSVMPLVIATDDIQSGAGFGASYERILDKNGYVSVYLPVIFTIISSANDYGVSGTTNTSHHLNMYAMPGIKLYPTGALGLVRYAVGPSLFIGQGQETINAASSPASSYIATTEHTYTLAGVMINNSVNISPTPHLSIGVELGLGISYSNNSEAYYSADQPIVQFNFRMGYRF